MAASDNNGTNGATEGMENINIASSKGEGEVDLRKSALRDNIDTKGKNAYYFAHASTPKGPKWDGKPDPKLLEKRSLSTDELEIKTPTSGFEYHKSNITSYAFSDEGKTVKLYLSMDDVGEKCKEEDDITLDWTESSFCLVVKNYKEEEQCLSFGKLTAPITNASYKLKPNRIIVILKKENSEKEWQTINDKGTPDHEIV